jgi:pimeloyl-ACP methyl ester carboxylesterase
MSNFSHHASPVRAVLFGLAAIPALLIGAPMNTDANADQTATPLNLTQAVTEGFVENNGVKIHYATLGQGPLIVLIHGHPDYWYGWRNQMPALAQKYQVVAIDQRGINLSDQPKGSENYAIQKLVGDVAAVIKAFKRDKAIIVGHDTGAAIAWIFATAMPQMTDRLITLNLPHPIALARERATNPAQQKASQLSLSLAQPNSAAALTPEQLLAVVNPIDPADRARYMEAFKRTNLETFVGYFQANLNPNAAGSSAGLSSTASVVKIKAPVLAIHGLRDPFVLADGYDRTWEFVDNRLTLVMLPNAGHYAQIDAADAVTNTMLDWLAR